MKVVAIIVFGAACADGDMHFVLVEDEGKIELIGRRAGLQQAFDTNSSIHVTYTSGTTCIPHDAFALVAGCSVTVDAHTIRINTRAQWFEPPGPLACPGQHLHADCAIGPVPDGSYTIEFRGLTRSLDIPSTALSPWTIPEMHVPPSPPRGGPCESGIGLSPCKEIPR